MYFSKYILEGKEACSIFCGGFIQDIMPLRAQAAFATELSRKYTRGSRGPTGREFTLESQHLLLASSLLGN